MRLERSTVTNKLNVRIVYIFKLTWYFLTALSLSDQRFSKNISALIISNLETSAHAQLVIAC